MDIHVHTPPARPTSTRRRTPNPQILTILPAVKPLLAHFRNELVPRIRALAVVAEPVFAADHVGLAGYFAGRLGRREG